MYRATRNYISESHPLYHYCAQTTAAAKLLYNASLFRLRNHFTARGKDVLTSHEQEVEAEVRATLAVMGKDGVSHILPYLFLEKLMRVSGNPDFASHALSRQTAQGVVKHAVSDMQSWQKALASYKKDPRKFLGRPKMPGYCKSDKRTVTFTNQDCRMHGQELKFPQTKERLRLPVPSGGVLRQVEVKPYYNGFLVVATFLVTDTEKRTDLPYMAGVDFGVDNIAAVATNEGHSLLFRGGAIKAENQFFNKRKAQLISIITKGHDDMRGVTSGQLRDLSRRRDAFVRDQFHKISARIVAFCLQHRVGTLVLGTNKDWKQGTSIGKENNQNFVSIPHAMLRFMITYKADRAGITVIEQEESYTSQASCPDGDMIPVYGEEHGRTFAFSGKRASRGKYVTTSGLILNADLNGAANIMRKAFPDAFASRKDFSYLNTPEVYGFHELNLSRIPVKGIAAA